MHLRGHFGNHVGAHLGTVTPPAAPGDVLGALARVGGLAAVLTAEGEISAALASIGLTGRLTKP